MKQRRPLMPGKARCALCQRVYEPSPEQALRLAKGLDNMCRSCRRSAASTRPIVFGDGGEG